MVVMSEWVAAHYEELRKKYAHKFSSVADKHYDVEDCFHSAVEYFLSGELEIRSNPDSLFYAKMLSYIIDESRRDKHLGEILDKVLYDVRGWSWNPNIKTLVAEYHIDRHFENIFTKKVAP